MNNNTDNVSHDFHPVEPMVDFANAHPEIGMGSPRVGYYVLVSQLLKFLAPTIWETKA